MSAVVTDPSQEGVRVRQLDPASPALTRAVAVLGASRRESNLGRRVLDALTRSGFKGLIYPVNPATADLGGVRCCCAATPGSCLRP